MSPGSALAGSAPFVAGVDIGGTFTDCAILGADGRVVTGKAPTTPSDLSVGFFDAVADAAQRLSMTLDALVAQTSRISHGTTTGLNALVTGHAADVALITTAGHRDAIRIMNDRGRALGATMAEMLDWSISTSPDPILPRELTVEVHERVNCRGEVVAPLLDEELARVASVVDRCGVQSVAICCLWSFANRDHEVRIRDALLAAHPEWHVSCSHEVAPRIGLYARAVTTVMNAKVAPSMAEYIDRVVGRARDLGFLGEVLFVQNDGGLVPATEAARFPVSTLKSGPVAGVMGASIVGRQFDQPDVIVADMGGTTFDVGLIRNGEPDRVDESVVQRQLVHMHAVDVESIGAGGGSIAWVDERTGSLRVGPRSAGARPGPICYGHGGTEVTVTDADLVLGILNPDRPLAGNLKLDRDLALDGLSRLGDRLGLDPFRCAAGVVEVVDSLMEDLIRRITVQRGQDPRDFSLWLYGGASGAHVGLFSRQLNVPRIVLPLGGSASVWSALGCTLLQQRREFSTSVYVTSPWDLDLVTSALEELESRARSYAAATGIRDHTIRRSANLKYGFQVHEIEVEIAATHVGASWADELVYSFERAYVDRFGAGTGFSGAAVTLTGLRVVLESHQDDPPAVSASNADDTAAAAPTRRVFWGELDTWIDTPILTGDLLVPGRVVNGPVILEYPGTTMVARPGQALWLDTHGNVVLEQHEAASDDERRDG